jgi:hypothetical protein
MVMQNWACKYRGILLRAGLKVPLLKGYVDDGRQGSTMLRKGMRFDDKVGEFVMDVELYKKDVEDNEPGNITDNLLRESGNQTETEMEDIPKKEQPKMRQPILSWPTKKSDESMEREHDKDKEMSEKRQDEQSNWVKGGGEEDNERYRNFLKYCGDRRQESKLQEEMDKERKKNAERRERQWDLIRLSTEYLKQNEPKWRTIKIKECERIK